MSSLADIFNAAQQDHQLWEELVKHLVQGFENDPAKFLVMIKPIIARIIISGPICVAADFLAFFVVGQHWAHKSLQQVRLLDKIIRLLSSSAEQFQESAVLLLVKFARANEKRYEMTNEYRNI